MPTRRGGERRRWIHGGNSREEEERRRSPRFWASTAPHGNRNNSNKQSKKSTTSTAGAGPSSTNTRTTMKKAMHSSMDSHGQDQRTLHLDNYSNNDESWLPEKRILELVLDTLQRRDTYEIFAEPVDPREVEEYYEIIKEPMDFGTMRAKLHEGMYKNLEQFERDVFLIFGNAMHFNSSGTVYFRQARALEELAKKVFHVLRTDPKNFEVEFAATRRRSSRGINYAELKDSNFGSPRKLDKHLQSSNMSLNAGRRGCKRERRLFMSGIDRRSTYNPHTLLDEKCSALSPIHHSPTLLIPVNNGDKIRYKESLMLFTKDLGPTAQRVAKRKLQDCLQMQTPSNPTGPNEGSNPKRAEALWFSRFRSCTLSNQGNMNSRNSVGSFDLNQVQISVSSDSSPTTTGCSKNDDFMSNMVSSMPLPMPAAQFTFDLPYLKSRMRELNDANRASHSYKPGSQDIAAWHG